MSKCDKCFREGEYPFEEQFLCLDHYEEAVEIRKENDRINAEENYKEDRRLETGRGPLRVT